MRQTEKFGLNLPDWTDPLSLAPINENTETIANLFGASARVCCGTYTGDGGATGRIETPGMRPVAVLMNARKVAGDNYSGGDLSVPNGWAMWVGEDLPAHCYKLEPSYDGTNYGDLYYHRYNTVLKFFPENGAVAWGLETPGDTPAAAVNNTSGTIYQWIAFGVAE